MLKNSRLLSRAAPAVVGVVLAGAAFAATADDNGDGPARCEIRATQQGSMIALDGMVMAQDAASGSYRFSVASVGGSSNTNIRQGGGFSAGAGDAVRLGRVMVGGSGSSYDVTLEVTLGAETIECSERVSGSI